MNNQQTKEHWENIYESTPIEETGWYEEHPTPSLDIIEQCDLGQDDPILDVGSGASTLIDELAKRGYREIKAVDISEKALSSLEKRLNKKELDNQVQLLVDDVTDPSKLHHISSVSLWHDRALLHFLRTEAERKQYVHTLHGLVEKDGYAVLAEFAPEGVDKCSGLDVQKYDTSDLTALLGSDFELVEEFKHTYVTPSGGERPYIYTLFKRTGYTT